MAHDWYNMVHSRINPSKYPALWFFAPKLFVVFALVALPFIVLPSNSVSSRLDVLNIKGNGPILLTAPHGIPHLRNGAIKAADADTTAIVRAMALLDDGTFHSITFKQRDAVEIARAQNWIIQDPNKIMKRDVPISPFFLAMKQMQHSVDPKHSKLLLVDIHGMKDDRECDVALGSAAWESWKTNEATQFRNCLTTTLQRNMLEALASTMDLKVDCLQHFTGDKDKERITVSRTAVDINIPAIQIELSKRLRTELVNEEKNILQLFSQSIKECYNNMI